MRNAVSLPWRNSWLQMTSCLEFFFYNFRVRLKGAFPPSRATTTMSSSGPWRPRRRKARRGRAAAKLRFLIRQQLHLVLGQRLQHSGRARYSYSGGHGFEFRRELGFFLFLFSFAGGVSLIRSLKEVHHLIVVKPMRLHQTLTSCLMAVLILDEKWLLSLVKIFLWSVQYATGYHLVPVVPPTTDGASLKQVAQLLWVGGETEPAKKADEDLLVGPIVGLVDSYPRGYGFNASHFSTFQNVGDSKLIISGLS